MQIGFRDAKLQRLFNDHESLQARFGPTLATRIASRMGLLKAALRLSFVPRDPPILLTPVDGSLKDFTVTLAPGRKLKFCVQGATPRKAGAIDLDSVTEIEISGIEQSAP